MPPGANLDVARLYHALREAGLEPVLSGRDRSTLLGLGGCVHLEAGVARPLPGIRVDHTVPRVQVGDITRAFVFPHALVDAYRSRWGNRSLQVSFRGLVTREREKMFERWRDASDVRITHTTRGRESGTKYWDRDYMAELGQSAYVLCPDGDCAYSYRTLEAALAGAMPIVQQRSACYGELDVLLLDEASPERLPDWSEERAQTNFEIARDLVTVPASELKGAVYRLGGWTNA